MRVRGHDPCRRQAGGLAVGLAVGLAAVTVGVAGASPAEGAGPPAVAVTVAVAVTAAEAAREQARQRWGVAARTFDAVGRVPDKRYRAADAASALWWEASRAGWRSPRVPRLVEAVLAAANPDGGYGLSVPWDAYQDGTVNPAATSYTATTVGHVGPVLLAGYQAGAVPGWAVRRTIDWVLDLRRPWGSVCVPYSASWHDLHRPCVWNVHFGAAAWVARASVLTDHRPITARIFKETALNALGAVRYDAASGYVPYSSADTRPQDIGHQLWTALSIDELRGDRRMMTVMLSKPLWRQQAQRFRDFNVAAAMSRIAMYDCRYAVHPVVLRHAAFTSRGTPYAFKASAAQARDVVARCLPSVSRARAIGPGPSMPVNLG